MFSDSTVQFLSNLGLIVAGVFLVVRTAITKIGAIQAARKSADQQQMAKTLVEPLQNAFTETLSKLQEINQQATKNVVDTLTSGFQEYRIQAEARVKLLEDQGKLLQSNLNLTSQMLDDYRTALTESQTLAAKERAQFTEQVVTLQNDITHFKTELHAKDNDLLAANTTITNLQGDLRTATEALNAKTAEVDKLHSDIEALGKRVADLERSNATQQTELDTLRQENKTLRTQVAERDARIVQLTLPPEVKP